MTSILNLPLTHLRSSQVDSAHEPDKLSLLKLLNTDSVNYSGLRSLNLSGPF